MRALSFPRVVRYGTGVALLVIGVFGHVTDGLQLAGVLGSAWPWAFLAIGVVLVTADLWLPAVAHRVARARAGEEHAALRLSEEQARVAFAADLDDLVREGYRVQDAITSGPIPASGCPNLEANAAADEYRARCAALLRKAAPARLVEYERAANAYLHENGGERTVQNIREAFAGIVWDSLLLDVQSCMAGLAAVQAELGRPFGGQGT